MSLLCVYHIYAEIRQVLKADKELPGAEEVSQEALISRCAYRTSCDSCLFSQDVALLTSFRDCNDGLFFIVPSFSDPTYNSLSPFADACPLWRSGGVICSKLGDWNRSNLGRDVRPMLEKILLIPLRMSPFLPSDWTLLGRNHKRMIYNKIHSPWTSMAESLTLFPTQAIFGDRLLVFIPTFQEP